MERCVSGDTPIQNGRPMDPTTTDMLSPRCGLTVLYYFLAAKSPLKKNKVSTSSLFIIIIIIINMSTPGGERPG